MTGFPDVLERLRGVPTERLVEVLGQIHRGERPSPLMVVPSVESSGEASRAQPMAAADSPVARTIPVAPASSTDQALHDLLEHRAQQSAYAARVRRFLSSLGADEADPLPTGAPQQLVLLHAGGDGARGSVVVRNPRSMPVSLTLRIEGPGDGGLRLEPESATLGAGESREIALVAVSPEPCFGRDVRVELDGEPTLRLRVELRDEPDRGDSDRGDTDRGDSDRGDTDRGDTDRGGSDRGPDSDELPRLSLRRPDDELSGLLREAQLLLLRHPLAAQALFRSVVAEGRRFGQTEEGRRMRAQLADSELIRRGRVLWEVGTLQMLEEEAPTTLPSKLLDAFVQATNDGSLEQRMIGLFGYGAGDGE